MGCGDPYVKSLRSLGYNVIRLPKADVRPLQLLAKKGGNLERIGELGTVLVAGSTIKLPVLSENVAAANVSGQRTAEIGVGLGLSLLGTIIGAMGGSKIGLDVAYKNTKSVTFEFTDVLSDSVQIAQLDQYLTDADLSPFSKHVGALLEADEIYVTTATIKSTQITVDGKSSSGTTVGVDVPAVQQLVGANVKVTSSGTGTSKLTYKGTIPLVFGFQAVRLFYEGGAYRRFESLKGDAALERASPPPPVLTEAAFVRLGDL